LDRLCVRLNMYLVVKQFDFPSTTTIYTETAA